MFSMMTANLRGVLLDDGEDSWRFRKSICLEVLKKHASDLIGFQEMQEPQRECFREEFPEYELIGVLDCVGGFERQEIAPVPESSSTVVRTLSGGHPMNSVMIRRDRFEVMSIQSFALSELPLRNGSISADGWCPRYAVVLTLRERGSGKYLVWINTHLDHKGELARKAQSVLINTYATQFGPRWPLVLTGDMNCDRGSAAIQNFFTAGWIDTFVEASGVEEPGHTFHRFLGYAYARVPDRENWSGKMDWIFRRGPLRTLNSRIVDDAGPTGRFPSDHFFIRAELDWA